MPNKNKKNKQTANITVSVTITATYDICPKAAYAEKGGTCWKTMMRVCKECANKCANQVKGR
ncbi:MAG: hypothetical protein FWE64_03400 [Alphaproteobacteria bacterium]|nr:hypothetical protein [Alphaproteobacteria bacterium]